MRVTSFVTSSSTSIIAGTGDAWGEGAGVLAISCIAAEELEASFLRREDFDFELDLELLLLLERGAFRQSSRQ